MVPPWLFIALIGIVLYQHFRINNLRRDLGLIERHHDYRIDFAMSQIDHLEARSESAQSYRWN